MGYIRKLYWITVNQFGFDLRLFLNAWLKLPRYIYDLYCFKKNYNGKLELLPCLHDAGEESGVSNTEYFSQDLHVAQKIFSTAPERHVDIGSRLDGFVAHVASFRDIEVFDIRKNTSEINGIIFNQLDLMSPGQQYKNYCDSISCLHALEHFGLGRYGDEVDTSGYIKGLDAISSMLKTGGVMYLSVPVGISKVMFNAHRIFDPREIIRVANECDLNITGLVCISSNGVLTVLSDIENGLKFLSESTYNLAIFTFTKK